MSYTEDILLQLSKDMQPSGRAFKVPQGGIYDRLLQALIVRRAEAYEDAVSTLNSIIPDNDNFTAQDCTDWCRRLGLIDTPDAPLSDRKAAIFQKMAYPGRDNPPRQAADFLQYQLREAGFDVYVYENIFPTGSPVTYVTKTPSEILGSPVAYAVLGGFELGEAELGMTWADLGVTLCVNYLEEDKDAVFDVGSNYRSTFYIAGDPITAFASVDADRKDVFRQMILKYKPAQTCAFLFVNYI